MILKAQRKEIKKVKAEDLTKNLQEMLKLIENLLNATNSVIMI